MGRIIGLKRCTLLYYVPSCVVDPTARAGAVHGIAGIVGGMFEKAPHGAVCAALLPWVFRHNVKSLSKEVHTQGHICTRPFG